MTVIDPTISPLDVPAADKARMWAEDRLVLLKAATERRLIERATQSAGGELGIGEPQVGSYVAFDIACTSPIQFIGLPPYAPGKIIAGARTRSSSRSCSSTPRWTWPAGSPSRRPRSWPAGTSG